MSVLWFIIAVPISVEVLAALLGFRDRIRVAGLRAQAIELLIVPTLALGVLLYVASPQHWVAAFAAFAFVLAWQVIVHVTLHVLARRKSFTASVVDTDQSVE
jgi:sterol desaturase/sphingolipid hydroxylase (fatty acid hydroxylase superfamily)